MHKWIFVFFAFTFAFAQEQRYPHETPEQIQQELDAAEAQFKHAKEMFNPWYAGPLLTGSATMMPPGVTNVQPYVFVTDNYGIYNRHRHEVNAPDLWQVNPQVIIQTGITSWMDTAVTVQTLTNSRHSKQSTFFGDTTISLGFKILEQGLWVPGIKIGINETFPTGRYQRLKPNRLGTDATGAGTYQTGIALKLSKLVFWSYKHPMNLRMTMTYNIPTSVTVHGLNAYGGASNTQGRVRPGNNFNISIGTEYSFTQRWVLANDVVYVSSNKTTFSGEKGTNSDGSPATVGFGSSDQLSLAPAIEYNPTPNLGYLAGVWFSVYGRNASAFWSAVATVTYTWGND